jgi:hypothetical protein
VLRWDVRASFLPSPASPISEIGDMDREAHAPFSRVVEDIISEISVEVCL